MSLSMLLSMLLIPIRTSVGQLINQDIHCMSNKSECTIKCSEYRSCALSSIFCNNATRCNVICSQQESCGFTTIYHTSFNQEIEINCLYFDSCKYLTVKFDENNSERGILSNRSLILNSLNTSSSPSMILSDITTFSDYTIHCLSDNSCNSMKIEINDNNDIYSQYKIHHLNLSMNINCVGMESCKHMILSVSDNWNANQLWQWDNFKISLRCNNSKSCEHVSVNTRHLKINSNSIGNTNYTTTTFGDLFIDCSNTNESCVFMDVTCPDLIPFHTMYDYLYQENKCHIQLNNSYNNHISIFSKHGMNTIDLKCNDQDDLICDGIILYCTQYSDYAYYCDMQYNYTNNKWFCDNYDNFYLFNADIQYGCDEYIWLDDIAIIYTSKIPDYTNQTSLSCKKYNPSQSLTQCYMYCDKPYSCQASHVYCDDVIAKCHFECSELQTCYIPSAGQVLRIECSTSADSICSVLINPGLLPANYGKFYSNYFVNAKKDNYVDFQISHNLLGYIYDDGMKQADFKILSSDDLVGWSNEYDVDSWWRVANIQTISEDLNKTMTPLIINILCERCYADWFAISGYDYNRNVSVQLECMECSGTDFNFWGITSFEFDCYGICSDSTLTLTDSNANVNCYEPNSCNNMQVYLNPSHISAYIDDKYKYNLNLLQTSSGIQVHSLYGFNQLDINYNSSQSSDDIEFNCGSPDYFNKYRDFDSIMESECLKSNSAYNSAVVALFEKEYQWKNITSQVTYCTPYRSCRSSYIHCTGDDCILHCQGQYSCLYARIYVNYYIGDIKYKQRSLKVYCGDYGSCHHLRIFANDIDYVEVNCLSGNSCPGVRVYYSDALSPAKGLNFTCYDINKTQAVIAADDKFQWPSCRQLQIYCPFVGCNINIEKSFYADPYDINIYYAKGFSELDLNCQFNPLTNRSTCYDVTYSCSLNNSINTITPIRQPHQPHESHYVNNKYLYHSTFNRYNGECIGECCDYIFSYSPTTSPTVAPTFSPSISPTIPPTYSPTAAPTRSPTIFLFDHHFNATFYIMILDDTNMHVDINYIKLNNNINDTIVAVKEALEYGYLGASSTSKSYDEYSVMIKNLNFDFEMDRIDVTTQIFVSSGFSNAFVAFTVNNYDFDENVADRLEQEWNVSKVEFDVYNLSIVEYKEKNAAATELTDYNYNIGTIAFISFTSCIWIIGILSLLHTRGKLKCLDKFPGIQPCDDEQYTSIIKYGAQALDLYSDIAFSWELYAFSGVLIGNDLTVIRILYSLSFVFFLLPFTINLIVAVVFQKFMSRYKDDGQRLSAFTQNWFNKYSRLFSIIVILSGSVSTSLQLINSSMFGHEFFHSGFSKYELSEMGKFRIIFNVLIENMPQFMIQLFYLNYFKGDIVSFTFVVSTCSSIISILSSIMEFFLKRQYKPRFQTKFNIEIILLTELSDLQFGQRFLHQEHSSSKTKIEVRDINVKKLHKRGNLRKAIKKNVAKCVCKLADNFELLYCYQQIDGLTLHGLCSSDDYKTLHQLFLKHKEELAKIVKKVYKIDGKIKLKKKTDGLSKKYWKVDFTVFDEAGHNMHNPAVELTEMNPDNKSFRIKNIDGVMEVIEIKQQKHRTETVQSNKFMD